MFDHFVFTKAHVRALFVALILAGLASPGLAQDAPEQKPDPPEPTATVFDEFDRGTPRGTAIGYLTACRAGDYTRAARYLDLRRVDPAERNTLGPQLARELKVVLDRQLWVPVDDLSEDPAGIQGDGLEAHVDRLGRIDGPDGGVEIDLERVPREDGVPVWQVSRRHRGARAATLRRVRLRPARTLPARGLLRGPRARGAPLAVGGAALPHLHRLVARLPRRRPRPWPCCARSWRAPRRTSTTGSSTPRSRPCVFP